jgi:ectoine hydroxylase-related dioxygenase (phytanoyl-CoA dioxygenase family)
MTSEQADQISLSVQRHGVALWPEFTVAGDLAALQVAADNLAAGPHALRFPKSTRVWDLFRHGPELIALLRDPSLTCVLTKLLGEHYLLSDYSLNVVEPGQPVDEIHIDYPFNEMPHLVHGSTLGVQCILALDTFTRSNGATHYHPHSHQPPRKPTSAHDPGPEHIATVPQGTLMIMAASTWHRSGFNASDQPRRAILLSFVERWIRPMMDPPEPGPWGESEPLRLLLGMQRPVDTLNGIEIPNKPGPAQ